MSGTMALGLLYWISEWPVKDRILLHTSEILLIIITGKVLF